MKKYIVKIIPLPPDLPYYLSCLAEREEWYETYLAEDAIYVDKQEYKDVLEGLAEHWIEDTYGDTGYVRYEIVEVDV